MQKVEPKNAGFENVVARIQRQASQTPQATALRFGERVVTYQQLIAQICRVAHYVDRHSKPGNVVGLYLDNSPEFLFAYFAILATGRICDAIETRTSPVHLEQKLAFSKPAFVIASEKYAQKLVRIERPVRVATWGEIELAFESVDTCETEAANRSNDDSAPQQLPLPLPDASAACMLKYTSGTTGNPKPMHIRHRAINYIATTLTDYFRIDASDTYYLMVPMQYLEGLGWICSVLSSGGSVIIAQNTFDYAATLADVLQHRVTLLSAVPLTLKVFVKHYFEQLQQTQQSLRVLCTSSAAMPVHITEQILRDTTIDFYTDYGLNEAPRVTFFRYREFPDQLTSIGRVVDGTGVQVTLVADDGTIITTANQHGEICIAGPQVIDGYLGDELATQRTIRNGTLHTGDFGYRDQDGLLYLVGRSDDVVNIGGEKVALTEVDQVVSMLDEIADAGCLAVEDDLRDYVVDAYVVLSDGVELTGEQTKELTRKLKRHCKQYLESYKVPRKFIVLQELPKTSLGKLQRKLLKQQVAKLS